MTTHAEHSPPQYVYGQYFDAWRHVKDGGRDPKHHSLELEGV